MQSPRIGGDNSARPVPSLFYFIYQSLAFSREVAPVPMCYTREAARRGVPAARARHYGLRHAVSGVIQLIEIYSIRIFFNRFIIPIKPVVGHYRAETDIIGSVSINFSVEFIQKAFILEDTAILSYCFPF